MTKKDIKEVAKKYGMDWEDLADMVEDMRSDGIKVTKDDLVDMIENGDM